MHKFVMGHNDYGWFLHNNVLNKWLVNPEFKSIELWSDENTYIIWSNPVSMVRYFRALPEHMLDDIEVGAMYGEVN